MGRFGGVSSIVVFMGLGMAQLCSAQQSVMSAAGYTGLSVTPTANLLPWGSFALSYANEVVGGPTTGNTYSKYGTSGHNVVVGFGMLPFLELSGRMATNKIQTNCYTDNCGIRDLSFNFKIGIALDAEEQFKIAVGANDFGGNANFFRTFYGVATYSPKNFDISAGYSRRGTELNGGTQPLDGIFASLAYKPSSWLATHVEYNDGKAWVGARVFAPQNWLPMGWNAHIGANLQVRGETRDSSKSWLDVGLTIPLYKVPEVRTRKASISNVDVSSLEESPGNRYEFSSSGLSPSREEIGQTPIEKITEFRNSDSTSKQEKVIGVDLSDEDLRNIAGLLKKKGFEDISVGRMINGEIAVKINNAAYNVNSVDALGVALGVVSRTMASHKAKYRLVITQRQLAIVGVTGQADCLSDWIALKSVQCIPGYLYTPGTSDLSSLVANADWVVQGAEPSWVTARLILEPVLRTNVATEYGVLDYSAGIRGTIQQPLWSGAYLEFSRMAPLSESKDYQRNGIFFDGRLVSQTDKALFHQVARVPIERIFGINDEDARKWGANALTAHIAAGRINSSYRGAYAEMRWEPAEGRHRFGLEGGRFERTTESDFSLPLESRSVLASYRYSFLQTRTDFTITAGQYLYNDRGAQLAVTQWFDDVSLSLYLRRTKYDFENTSRSFAGIELTIPLTPRKDMNPIGHLQVTGASRWSYGIETKVGSTNYVSSNQGVFPGVSALNQIFNADRSGVNYFEQNMSRIRSAAAL